MMEGEELAAWLSARAGKLTASRMRDAMALLKNGQPAKARSDLLRELLAERITGSSVRHYVTDAMAWGLEKEAEAKAAYEAHAGILINECGFYDHPTIDAFGATPDGLIGADRLIETKAPTTQTFVEWTLAGVVPEEHKPQMCAQLACTGRRAVVFVAFDPRIKNPARRLFVREYEPSREEVEAIETAAQGFLAELERMFCLFTETAA